MLSKVFFLVFNLDYNNMSALYLLLLLPLVALSDEEDCPRLRKSWYTLSNEEKSLYIEGFQKIRKNGKMDIISASHDRYNYDNNLHFKSKI